MIITKKRHHPLTSTLQVPILYLDNLPLERVSEYNYLGILLTDDLRWDHHINIVCNKMRRMIGLIYRQLYMHSSDFLLKLYKTIIRPHLEYACVVWSPHQRYLIDQLVAVEKFTLRMCLKSWNSTYSHLLCLSGIQSIIAQHDTTKLLLMYKIIYKIDSNIFSIKSH